MKRYLIVVMPAPVTMPATGSTTYSNVAPKLGPDVSIQMGRSHQDALSKVKVQPGGHAYVVAEADARRFNRAAVAPLVETMFSGEDFPTDGTVTS